MGINGLFLEYWQGKCLAKIFTENKGTCPDRPVTQDRQANLFKANSHFLASRAKYICTAGPSGFLNLTDYLNYYGFIDFLLIHNRDFYRLLFGSQGPNYLVTGRKQFFRRYI